MTGGVSEHVFPPAEPHGELEEVFPDVFFVIGSVGFPGPVPMRFSRNMVVLRNDDALTLINTVRLSESGLAKLEALGNVKHIIRLAGFHGMDDAFYRERYGAKVWAVKGHVYAPKFLNTKLDPKDGYFQADVYMDDDVQPPVPGAKLITLECAAGEGLLHLDREGGVLIAGDALQNWGATNRFFSLGAKVVMKLMGFIKPYNLGPGWIKQADPNPQHVKAILDLNFEHVLPSHGDPVLTNAKEKFRPAIERFVGT